MYTYKCNICKKYISTLESKDMIENYYDKLCEECYFDLNYKDDENKGSYTGQCTTCGGDMYSYHDGDNLMTGCEDCGDHKDYEFEEPSSRHEDPWERCEPDLSDIEGNYDE